MTHVITQNCCNDASCVFVCPVNCIHPAPGEPDYATAEMLYIDPQSCIDCGACLEVCPVDAIVPDFELTSADEPYVDLNADYFAGPGRRDYPATQRKPSVAVIAEGPNSAPLRVAIVGSGPSALYAAERLLAGRGREVEVSMLERLPTPFGLVRYGVAPDHAGTKGVLNQFNRFAGRKRLSMFLGVEVGTDITHQELLDHHDAVIYATGAASDRRLGIEGEDLPGSSSATQFVAWYNGHPDHADDVVPLGAQRAVIVGNGNVALDVARVLTVGVDQLAKTDIADHALAALADSQIEEVVILGRRGPAQAAFTTPELLGLRDLPGLDVLVDPAELVLAPEVEAGLSAPIRAKVETLREFATNTPTPGHRRIVLRFQVAPVQVLGKDSVTGVKLAKTTLIDVDGRVEAVLTDATEELDCGLLLRSVGYRSRPLADLPYDEVAGRLPQQDGRVVDPVTGKPLPGVYAVGWVKRGPQGVIGTNKFDAEQTVETLLADLAAGGLPAAVADGPAFAALVSARQSEVLSYDQWRTVDRAERAAGKAAGRPRVKLTRVKDITDAARA